MKTGLPQEEQHVGIEGSNIVLTELIRNVHKHPHGHYYYRSPAGAKWASNVNTHLTIDVINDYMAADTTRVVTEGDWQEPCNRVRYEPIIDVVATLRAACSTPESEFWRPSLRWVTSCC